MNSEMNDLIKECDEKDKEIENLKKYYDNRILKLRGKCIDRNAKLDRFKYWVFITFIITWYIAVTGIYETILQFLYIIQYMFT